MRHVILLTNSSKGYFISLNVENTRSYAGSTLFVVKRRNYVTKAHILKVAEKIKRIGKAVQTSFKLKGGARRNKIPKGIC
jgi:hypothetical protein